jgi:tetratricopeptide (TPR) repeat protein
VDINQTIKLEPAFLDAHLSLGKVYQAMKRYKKAIKNYDTVIKLNPKHEDAKINRKLAYKSLRKKS